MVPGHDGGALVKLWLIPLAGIAAIVILEIVALLKGIDGSLLAIAFSAIGAIATGGAIKIWGKIKGKGLDINIGGGKE